MLLVTQVLMCTSSNNESIYRKLLVFSAKEWECKFDKKLLHFSFSLAHPLSLTHAHKTWRSQRLKVLILTARTETLWIARRNQPFGWSVKQSISTCSKRVFTLPLWRLTTAVYTAVVAVETALLCRQTSEFPLDLFLWQQECHCHSHKEEVWPAFLFWPCCLWGWLQLLKNQNTRLSINQHGVSLTLLG